MIVGTADVAVLAKSASRIDAWTQTPTHLGKVEIFQLTSELRFSTRESLLPPALHPTSPPTLTIQAWVVGESPWGSFSLVLTRIGCRSGSRPRGFVTAAVASTADSAHALASRFGYPCRQGDVELVRRYDGVDVGSDGLRVRTVDPEPMSSGAAQYTNTMNLAHTPLGLQLVQVDTNFHVDRLERLHGRVVEIDGARWGSADLDPYHFVSGSIAVGSIEIAPLRFLCDPHRTAFSGTQRIPLPPHRNST